MSIKASNLRNGMGVKWKDGIWIVFKVDHVVKGKGGSLMQIDLRNAKTGQLVPQRFGVNDKLEEVYFDRKKMEYLYSDNSNHVLMDESYEQFEVPKELLGELSVYLTENLPMEVCIAEGKIMSIEIPHTVTLKITDTPPQVKGATATNQYKEAICEGGAKVKVPPFVNNEEEIIVDTRTGEYVSRA